MLSPVSPVPPQDELDAIDCSEEYSDEFISANATDFKYGTPEDPFPFLQKQLNVLIRGLCFSKEKTELLALRLKK